MTTRDDRLWAKVLEVAGEDKVLAHWGGLDGETIDVVDEETAKLLRDAVGSAFEGADVTFNVSSVAEYEKIAAITREL